MEIMPLNQKHIAELRQIYFKHTGKSLSNQEAWDMARRLIYLFRLLLPSETDKNQK